MSTALGLAMQISANTAQLAQAVQDVNKRLDEMGSAGKKAADDLGVLKNIEIAKLALGGIKAAGSAFLSLSKSVIGATESIVNFGKSVADELDALNDVANRTGVGVEALQAYGGAAKLAGTDLETFARSIQKLTVNIGKAATDEKAQEAFTKLGLSFEDLRQKTPTEQFEAIADAISRIADPAERAAAAVSLFGKGGVELGPLFSEGPGALAKMREEAVALGQVVSEDSIKSIAKMNDAFDKVWMTVKGLTGQIVGELADPIAQIAEDLLNVVKEVGATNIAQNVAAGLLSFIELAGNAFFNLAKFIEGFVVKYGKILGIETRSESQQQRDSLVAQRDELQRIVDAGGETLVRRLALGVRQATPEDRVKLQELNAAIAALPAQNDSALAAAAANFNESIAAARASVAKRLQQPAVPQGGTGTVQVAGSAAQGASDDQTRLLGDIARNTRPAAVVELPR
jgi:hypothetical protein